MNWILASLHKIWAEISKVLNANFFNIGEKSFSLLSIFQVLFYIILVLVISRAISVWIKHRLLVRMGFDRGSREAISAVIGYGLGAIGVLIVLQTAGIQFSSLAVFAGVLGIGLGLSLQNIASNFISGLTLLFEQPIKVGDFIEVDGLMGTVETISIRSTIVRTIDNISVIVPNLRFVESKIVNWSYRDPKCCIHIPVDVDYDAEPVMVTEALLSAARRSSGVLSYPSPKVWFKGFKDGDLHFELLVWIDEPAETEAIKSAIYFAIEHEFRQRNIRIPLPQQELSFRNIDELRDLFQKGKTNKVAKTNKILNQNQPTSDIKNSTYLKSPNNWTLRDLLRRITYFEQCSDLELRQLIEYGYRQLFPAGSIVCQENDPGDSFYMLLTGSVEVYSQRIQKYIATLHEGEFFGEMSLLMGMPRSATVRSLEDSILFVVERHDLQKLLVSHPGLADQIALKLSERQQALKNLGLLPEGNTEETPVEWIRKRLQTLFGI